MNKSEAKRITLNAAEEVLPGGYIGVNIQTKELIMMSEGFEKLTGYLVQELQEKKLKWSKAVFHPQDVDEFEKSFETCFETSARAYNETRIMCKDGTTIWVDVYAGIVQSKEHGEYVHFNFIDNTKRRRDLISAENTRREMDAIIMNMPGGVARIMMDKDFKIIFASDGFYKLTGYTKEEYHGVPVLGRGAYLIAAEDIERVRNQIAEQAAHGEQFFVEYRLRKKDGSIAWIEAHGAPVSEQNGIVQAQVIFTDTTAAKYSARRLLRLTNSVPGGVAHLSLTDETVTVDFASDGFYRILGYAKDEFSDLGLAQNAAPLFSPKDWKEVRQTLKSFFDVDRINGELECKIRDSDGEIRYINVKGSKREEDKRKQTIECVITDVTKMHKSLEKLRQDEERYRFISEQMTEIIVEWDIITGDIYHSIAFERRFGYRLPEKNAKSVLLNSDLIYTDDVELVAEIMENIQNGSKYAEAEYRLKDINGSYQWCGIHLTNVFDEDGKPFKAIGIIMDMANVKENTARLEQEIQLDPLTGAFNTIATRGHITESLRRRKPEHASAMFAIDIDDFKSVNDGYGHAMGDEVLIELTQRIRSLIRPGDIFGRVGGDEFVVFIPNDMSEKGALQKAKSFIQTMQKSVLFKGVECTAYISVGVSLCPLSGESYDVLYDKADKALYTAKENGRNRFEVFKEG